MLKIVQTISHQHNMTVVQDTNLYPMWVESWILL